MVVHLEYEWLRDLKCRGTRGQALKHDGYTREVVHEAVFKSAARSRF
jgi:hypothetical protein